MAAFILSETGFTNLVANLSILTYGNNHAAVSIEVAKYFHLDKFCEEFDALRQQQERVGYLTDEIKLNRIELSHKMLRRIKMITHNNEDWVSRLKRYISTAQK